jgi:fructose-1,6-bisphosphatase/inositol monophosphatase family enzyme
MVRIEDVDALIREVSAREIMPRFRALAAGDIEEKSKGDFVTVADRLAEAWLTPKLEVLLPGSLVLGEEAVAASPALISRIEDDRPVWVVDPVDGTGNFVNGNAQFGTMIALVVGGQTRQAWIYLPVADAMAVAEEGSGAYWFSEGRNERLASGFSHPALDKLWGGLNIKHMPAEWQQRIKDFGSGVGRVSSYFCAASEYTSIARGLKDFVTFYRMYPWDHAPGSLILREAGGVVRDIATGADYGPRDLKGPYLVARDEAGWNRLAKTIQGVAL